MTQAEIEQFIKKLQKDEINFKGQNSPIFNVNDTRKTRTLKSIFQSVGFISKSLIDFILITILLIYKKSFVSNQRFVFTSKNFCTEVNGVTEDRIVKPLFTTNIIFINHSKEYTLNRINGLKVFNLGGVVKLLGILSFRKQSHLMSTFQSYMKVNNAIISRLNGNEVYTLCYYDLNGLSIVFSKFRNKIKYIEVQHGSIVNYPPYMEPAPFKIVDIFYVKNKQTIEYLKKHLCLNYGAEYRLIPYPIGDWKFVNGLHILYASTLEFNGLHPVFSKFLSENTRSDLRLNIRLHPRESDKEGLFIDQLEAYNINYKFDYSKNWLEGNSIKNLIVISPWSSIIEEAVDNGFKTVIIDELGRDRFSSRIDNSICYYSSDLVQTFNDIIKSDE